MHHLRTLGVPAQCVLAMTAGPDTGVACCRRHAPCLHHHNYGRGQRGGRGGGGRGGGNRSDAPRGPKKKNYGGRKCHQCDSEYHLIRDCPQVPPKHQARGHALVTSNEFVHDFWKAGSGSTSKSKSTDKTLYVEDGYGGFTEFCG